MYGLFDKETAAWSHECKETDKINFVQFVSEVLSLVNNKIFFFINWSVDVNINIIIFLYYKVILTIRDNFFFLVINIGNLMIPTVAIGAALGATGLILGAKGAALTLSSGYF